MLISILEDDFMNQEIKEIISLLKKAGNEVLKIYRKEYRIFQKEDKTLLTEADLISEKIILEGLRKYNYGILSEEKRDYFPFLSKEKIWVIDPLDGTEDFLQKTGDFSIMVGLIDQEEPVLGVVYLPAREKIYWAEKKNGAYLKENNNPLKKLRVSRVTNLKDSRFVVSRFHLDEATKKFMKENKIRKIETRGSIGLKLGLIAEGKADAYLTFSNKTYQWDTCAPEIILKEAGGKITDLKGKSLLYQTKELKNLNGIVASNGILHNKLINLYREFNI